MNRTTIHLGDADREAIRRIRERWGIVSDSAAIRLAVRALAEADSVTIPAPQTTDYSPPAAGNGHRKENQ